MRIFWVDFGFVCHSFPKHSTLNFDNGNPGLFGRV
jgi:hypothetical protein